jgi:hypothetical protein
MVILPEALVVRKIFNPAASGRLPVLLTLFRTLTYYSNSSNIVLGIPRKTQTIYTYYDHWTNQHNTAYLDHREESGMPQACVEESPQ